MKKSMHNARNIKMGLIRKLKRRFVKEIIFYARKDEPHNWRVTYISPKLPKGSIIIEIEIYYRNNTLVLTSVLSINIAYL